MGCVEPKFIDSEEISIVRAEQCLGFQNHTSKEVDSTIRKYSSNGFLNQSQFAKVAEILEISILNTPSNNQIQGFFRKIMTKSEQYPLKDLLVIGILLSEGTAHEKSKLIYEIFDDDLTNSLDLLQVKEKILKNLVYHSSVTLPSLLTTEQIHGTTLLKTKKYLDEIHSIANVSISKTANIFGLVNVISQEAFSETFTNILNGSLTNSSGWRRFMAETYVIEPPRRSFEPLVKNEETMEAQTRVN